MAQPPIIALKDIRLGFGGAPLFTGVEAAVAPGEKVCLVGRNGSGKSTLLKIMAGEVAPDSGEVFVQPGARVARLEQEPRLEGETVAAYVAAGLPAAEREETHRAEAVLERLGLDAAADPATLSGGQGRRAALARALVGEPDVLLLDEPTNHLDLPAILWLEERLRGFRGALVVISHDRAFLAAVSGSTWWLDRGTLRANPKGFADFDRWSEEVYAAEEAELARMDKKLLAEARWLHRGVTARRKRNQGRLRALAKLRQERRERQRPGGALKLEADAGAASGRLVIEARGVGKSFGDDVVVRDFSTRILRGDRVGVIGPNGAGKTTLLRLLIGRMEPDAGTVRLGTNLEIAWFDQRREALDPDETVWRTLTGGSGDQVWVRGKPRHVVGYLRDFLFEERQALMPVKALSGGERARLLLARLLARPSNLLVLDEPTNDLDMDTLDLLQEALADYDGTLLLVSHDRDFLDRLVTSVIAVEGGGEVGEYAGGYGDYLRQRGAPPGQAPTAKKKDAAREKPRRKQPKLSYHEQRDLERLPRRMEELQAEAARLEATLADPDLYARDPAAFEATGARLEELRRDLEAAEDRWLELEMKREELASE